MWWCIRNSSAANFVGCTSSSTRFALFSCSTSVGPLRLKIGRVGTAIFIGVVVFVFFSSSFPLSIFPLRDGRFYDWSDVVAGVAVFHCNGDGQCLPQSCGTLLVDDGSDMLWFIGSLLSSSLCIQGMLHRHRTSYFIQSIIGPLYHFLLDLGTYFWSGLWCYEYCPCLTFLCTKSCRIQCR
jgi:hypothetical protein